MRSVALGTALLAQVVLVAAIGVAPAAAGPSRQAASPTVAGIQHGPVAAGQPITVVADIAGLGGHDAALEVVVGFAAPTDLALRDDGAGGDAVAGDGRFTAQVPARPAGTLVRWAVRIDGPTPAVRFPEVDGFRRYEGVLVERPSVATSLPVLDWHLSAADAQWLAANRGSRQYVPSVLVVGDRVIDGAEVRNQGGFTSSFSPKPNFKFKLPGDEVVAAPYFDDPVDEFVVDADHEDPTSAMGPVAWDLFAAAGVPERHTATARVERNGSFYGLFQLYQEYDGTWLDQVPGGVAAFYEGTSGEALLIDEGDLDALLARWEQAEGDGTGDLEALVAALDHRTGPRRVDALVDQFDPSSLVDLLAMSALVQHFDAAASNMDLLRSDLDGRWRIVPNDLDLTLGLRGRTRYDDLEPRVALPSMIDGYADADTWARVARRIRTLVDEWLADDRVLDDVRARVQAMPDDLVADRAAWPLVLPTAEQGLADLDDFLDQRRAVAARWTNAGLLPPPQAPTATARISELSAAGGTGDFVELANPDRRTAIDVSGWSLSGAATVELPGGTVLPPGGRLVVPASSRAIAALDRGVLVGGQLTAPLPAGGGTVVLADAGGAPRDSVTWSTGGAWPTPGASGRTLEAKALDGTRGSAAGWALSAAPGGTPGEAGASARGLDVDVWAVKADVPETAATAVRIVVANAGPGDRTGVVLDGPGPSCDRTLGTVPAGSRVVVRCSFGPASSGFRALTATVTAAEDPDGARSAPLLIQRLIVGGPPAAPTWGSLRLVDGAVEGTFDPGLGGAPLPVGGRIEQHAIPLDGSEASGSTVDVAGPARLAPSVPSELVLAQAGRGGSAVLGPSSPPLTAHPSATWPFASVGAAVDRWYLDLAGRPATAGERSLWAGAVASGGKVVDVANHLYGQPRWQSQVDPIVRLYLAHFGRLPDDGGLRYWVSRRWSGQTLDRLSRQFAGSSEFERRYGGLSTEEVVDAIYRNVFGRDADPGGRAYWVGRVERGYPVSSVVTSFSESGEGKRLAAPTVESVTAWFAFHRSIPSSSWLGLARPWVQAGLDPVALLESARSDPAYAQVVDE